MISAFIDMTGSQNEIPVLISIFELIAKNSTIRIYLGMNFEKNKGLLFVQNVKDWPLFVKICFGIIFGALVLAGLVEKPKLDIQKAFGDKSSQDVSKELVDIDIIVQSEAYKPLKDVKVTFNSKGSPEVRNTNTDGFARISIPVRDDVEITLEKKGFEISRHTLKTSNDPKRVKTYYLRSQKS